MTGEGISFHESTITAFSLTGDTLTISFEGIATAAGMARAIVTASGIRRLLRDDVELATFDVERLDGEVLTLEIDEHQLRLIVEWNDWTRKESTTHAYLVDATLILTRFFH